MHRHMSSGELHIVLVRHGQTDANRDHVVQGHQPTRLNSLGLRQAELVAERLERFAPRIDRIVCSDLPRTVQTAAPLARRLGLEVHYDPSWRERCYGTFEGKTLAERKVLRETLGLATDALPPGAQSEPDYQSGIRTALLALPGQFPQSRCIAVVTHGGACRAVTMMLADGRLPAAPGNPVPQNFNCPNAAVTHLIRTMTTDGPVYRYGCLYDISHLEALDAVTLTDAG